MQSHCLMPCAAWWCRTLRLWLCTVCALWYGDGHTVSVVSEGARVRINLFWLHTGVSISFVTPDCHDGIRGYTGMVGWYGMVHSHCTTGSLSTLYRTLTCCQSHGHTVTVYSCYFYWYTRCHWYTFSARRLRDSRLSTPHAHRFASQRFTLAHRQLQLIAVTSMIVVFMN